MTGDNQKWLEHNTFHHGEFWDILDLVKEKEKKDLKTKDLIDAQVVSASNFDPVQNLSLIHI